MTPRERLKTTVSSTQSTEESHYRTKNAASSLSREICKWNACKWQTRRDDVMVCLGERCPYRFCDLADDELPPRGSACEWEQWYARCILAEFDETYPAEGIGRHMDDRDALRIDYALGCLQANRASVRLSRAMESCLHAVSDRGMGALDQRPFHEYALADRYLAAAHNRIKALHAQVPVIEERIRLKKIRSAMVAFGVSRLEGRAAPDPADAPDWLLSIVDMK